MADQRLKLGSQWVASQLGEGCEVRMLAGDASFRRYFRVFQGSRSFVLMDAPPGKEDVTPFLEVRSWLAGAGVRVPALIHEDRAQGFLLLEDFGDVTWASHLNSAAEPGVSLEALFEDALTQLKALQGSTPPATLPLFDVKRMQRECDLYLDWYLPKVASYTPSHDERSRFHLVLLPMLEEIAALPRVPVHLDYHSRNLMLPAANIPLGMIDFQDAVIGPVTYDLASLLYDCYQNYPEDNRRQWSRYFYDMLSEELKEKFGDFDAWHRALRLTATQRHIKAIGIFGRLAHRDGKHQFLDEIPLTRQHLREEMQALAMDGSEYLLLTIHPA